MITPEFEVIDTPTTLRRRSKWDQLRAAIRELPAGKSIKVPCREGYDPQTFANLIRQSFRNDRGYDIPISVSIDRNQWCVYVSRQDGGAA